MARALISCEYFTIHSMKRHADGWYYAECEAHNMKREKFYAIDRWGSWMVVADLDCAEKGPWGDMIHDWAAVFQEQRRLMERTFTKAAEVNPFFVEAPNPFMVAS